MDCGSIYPVYELEKQASIKDVVSVIDNPFDEGKSFLGIDNRKLGKKRRKDKDTQYDYINDEELKRELKKGAKLLSYSEYMPQ